MSPRRRWFRRAAALGALVTPVFLFLLLVTGGAECAGPCDYPVWTAPLMALLFLAGPVAVVAGLAGLAFLGPR